MNNTDELQVRELMECAGIVAQTLGGNWISKKIKEDRAESRRFQLASKNRRHAYLYRPQPHPLIAWAIEFERMQKESVQSRRLSVNDSVLKFSVLGKSLKTVRDLPGFGKLVDRLKKSVSFFSAAFEAEVAASYVAKGYSVKFVDETPSVRTPDLKITRPDGSVFWAECKCRDALSERDRRIDAVWSELQKRLLAEMSPRKLNAIVVIQSITDPQIQDINSLLAFVINSYKQGGCGEWDSASGKTNPISDPSGRYLVVVRPLSAADEKVEGNGFQFHSSIEFDHSLIALETYVAKDSRHFYRNPIVLAFKNSIPTDKITGIIHGLKSAVGQLPKDEAGVVWIRVPDNAWNSDIDGSFATARALIESELRGEQNRRVNAVILMTRLIENLRDGELTGLAYRPLIISVEHPNPRSPAPSST